MTPAAPLESYYQQLFYKLLPGLYRARDANGDLERFVAVFGHGAARLRANVDQLYRDLFIDSCQDWVIPYLADLLDANVVLAAGNRSRAEVRNTIKWRRQKGTLGGLEDIAAEIGGWGAHATEMLAHVVWSQNLNYLRPQAVQSVNLAAGRSLSRLATPFDPSLRSVDLRLPDGRDGAHGIRGVRVSYWPIASNPRAGATPARMAPGRWRFDPLGRDTTLMSASANPAAVSDTDASFPHARDTYIRDRDFAGHPAGYFGQPWGFGIYEDGILLCETGAPAPPPSAELCDTFFELARNGGMQMDAALFGAAKPFRVTALRLAWLTTLDAGGNKVPVPGSPTGAFANQLQMDGAQAGLETAALAYGKGLPYRPGAPDFHHPALVLRIERQGAAADFPESELIVHNADGGALLIYLPGLHGLAAGQQFHLYVAQDGSVYFARHDHGPGDIDLNPNSASLGAFLPHHLARAALGQFRPRPGLRPLKFRRAVYRPLCCWDQPLQRPPGAGEVAVDPSRGRFAFPAGEEPAGSLTVDYRFGLTGAVGAGPYFRGDLPPATLTVSQSADADHDTMQAAILAAPAGNDPVIIEIRDSLTYREALVVNRSFPGGLTIRARALEMPVIQSPGGDVLAITADCASVTLDGVTLAGGAVTVTGNVPLLRARYTTLDPRTSGVKAAPAGAGARLVLENAIAGPLVASANVAEVNCTASAVQEPAGGTAIDAVNRVSLDRATAAGAIRAQALTASNCILHGSLQLADSNASCLRYSRYPKEATARHFRATNAWPVFVSLEFGHPGWLHLAPNTSDAIRTGGENGGEMGVFYDAGVPWREQNTFLKLAEYLPAGLRVAPGRVLPPRRFPGVKKS